MRNLEVTKCVVLSPEALLSRARCFCLDCDKGSVWVVTSNDLCSIEEGKVNSMAPLSSHMTTEEDSVVGIEFVGDLESVCMAISSGDVLVYNTSTSELDCVGNVEVGVVCMGWSPEQDVVVLVTKEDKLVLMTRDFDSITEVALHPDDFGEAKPVTVGWGKKETQFHGSQGKPKAEQLAKKPVAAALEGDDQRTRISWRGDGEYFACSSINPSIGARQLRVWSRECVLHSTSEAVNGMEQSLHWRPNGSLIGSTQQKPHRHDVIFFERNGLQHGEFPLKSPSSTPDDAGRDLHVQEMMWNSDSSVLALWVVERKNHHGDGDSPTSDLYTYVQLWTSGNYHWYLKQELCLPEAKDPTHCCSVGLVGILWDPILPLTLHMLTTDGQYMCYNWRWSISKSHSCSSLNSGCVSVVDGQKLLLTPFRHTVVPPPMAAHTVHLPSVVNQVAFAPPPRCNDFLVVLASGQVGVFSYDIITEGDRIEKKDSQGFRAMLDAPHLLGLTDIPLAVCGRGQLHCLRQLVWWKTDRLLGACLQEEGGGGGDTIVEFSLELNKEKKSLEIKQRHCIPLPGAVLNICNNPDSQSVAVQLTDGTVLKYNSSLSDISNTSPTTSATPTTTTAVSSPPQDGITTPPSVSPWLLSDGREMRFPDTCCEHIAMATFKGQECLVGLSESRRSLYVRDKKLMTGCTSFAVHNEFLLFTTDTHTCRFLPLDSDPQALSPLSSDKPLVHDESLRRVERGSKIVTVVPHDTRLVLQMPRGNLETISPRALVLSCVRRHLDQVEFKSAFVLMRKHRINLNLIYDHNPQVFLNHSKEFVQQLDSVTDINLFLTELKSEDLTSTMYPGFKHTTTEAVEGGGHDISDDVETETNKVDRVCVALRGAMSELGSNKYLLSIITTYVKMTEPQLETVLTMITQLKEKSSSDDSTGDALTAEDALKYTLFLVDVNQLYDVALGMYDFSLVLLVAEKSQKDPKEYLPFLNELRKLPLHYQRYRIDRFLRRFEKALQHISKCGSDKFPECLALVKDHSLYNSALTIFTDRASDEFKTIAKAYGEHLQENGRQREAGIMFCQCECLEEAMVVFEKAGCWRQVFTVSAQLNKTSGERMTIARRIANSLKTNRRYSEAAQVLLDYADDVEEAIVILLEGSCWEEALRLVHLHRRTDLLETHLKPGLLEAHQSHLSLFETLQSTYLRHTSRLAVVREEKRRKQNAILEGTYAADEKDADLFSDTSSITGRSAISSVNSSLISKMSGRSTKNRRKAERKKHSLREGSANEDFALMEALSEIVNTVDRLQDEVSALLGMLALYGFTSEGRDVQRTFTELLTTVKSKMDTIWPPQKTEQSLSELSTAAGMTAGPGTTVNSIVAALTAAKTAASVNSSGVALTKPTIRDSVHWKLGILNT